MSGELDIYTPPADWVDSETPSETKLNQQIRDNANVLGLVVAGVLAASFSTYDSIGSTLSSLIVRDVYARLIVGDRDDRRDVVGMGFQASQQHPLE